MNETASDRQRARDSRRGREAALIKAHGFTDDESFGRAVRDAGRVLQEEAARA